mgnify:CR=1 FL=1
MIDKIKGGIDVDGVLRDFDGEVVKILKEHGVDAKSAVCWDDNIDKKIDGKSMGTLIWDEKIYLQRVFEHSDVYPQAKTGYYLFCDDPNIDVYVVTDQKKDTEHHTYRWLKNKGFNQHTKTCIEKNKLKACCHILIDDKPDNIKAYKNDGRIGMLMDRPHNKSFNTDIRVSNLVKAYSLIKSEFFIDL